MKSSIAIYPGTFDPITKGHIDLITRASRVFDQLIVGVARNQNKGPLFSLDERVYLIKQVTQSMPKVSVVAFSGLLIDFASEQQAQIIVRGLRAVSDFEFEIQMAAMNQQLRPEVETFFLSPSAQYAYLSSTMVRDVARHQGDTSAFVPEVVAQALHDKFTPANA